MDADTARLEAWMATKNGQHAIELARELVKTLAVDNMMGVTINGIGHVTSIEASRAANVDAVAAAGRTITELQSKLPRWRIAATEPPATDGEYIVGHRRAAGGWDIGFDHYSVDDREWADDHERVVPIEVWMPYPEFPK